MLLTDFKKFQKLAKKGNLVPVVEELMSDLDTPVSAFLKLSKNNKSVFLFESVEYGEKIGRFSFIGVNPELIVEAYNEHIVVNYKKEGIKKRVFSQKLMPFLSENIKQYKVVTSGLPHFCGGFVGYFSYENVADFEDIKLRHKRDLNFPLGVFFLMKDFVLFDHLQKKIKIVSLAATDKRIKHNYRQALNSISVMKDKLKKQLKFNKKQGAIGKGKTKLVSNYKKDDFLTAIKKIKRYIKAGDVIQVVLSQRFSLGKVKDGFKIYRALRTVNPSPYMFFFKHNDMELIGASPEMLAKKDGIDVQVRPIAGTRKRGLSFEEDKKFVGDLLNDKKECAEHLMLVDLGRNDLGRCCNYKSVYVADYARIEKYSHVMHMVSEVHGKISKNKNAFDLIACTFPAGTLSGAPKIRAMEIIDELEPSTRGPYGGAVGYFSFDGNCDMCITIRTIMVNNGNAYIQAGAGIVYDSVPIKEYEETINKAKALFKAVEVAEEYF